MLELVNVLTASLGDSTIGSPPRLNDVFNKTDTPILSLIHFNKL